MAIVVEDGSGLANADSYLSVDDADTFHAAQGNPSTWSTSTTPQKEAALRQATLYMDSRYGQRWLGRRINSTMSLRWPRTGIFDRDGISVEDDAVPTGVKNATAYIALKIREGDTLIPDVDASTNAISESVQVGAISISSTYAGEGTTAPAYPMADMLLGDLITAAGTLSRT